jgi:hypothetical protein
MAIMPTPAVRPGTRRGLDNQLPAAAGPSRTWHAWAPAWRTTLLIASTTIRKVATSTRPGRAGVNLEGDLNRCALGQAPDMRGDRPGQAGSSSDDGRRP